MFAIGLDRSRRNAACATVRRGKLPKSCADSHGAGRLAAEHFLERGFRNFGFCGYEGRLWSDRRQEGFCERLQEAGFSCHIFESFPSKRNVSWNAEMPRVAAWLKSLPKPAAILACNDNRGRQVLEAGHLARLLIPDEVAVVGVDNDEMICTLSDPPLSSVALNLENAGYQAAEFLDILMDNPKLRRRTFRSKPAGSCPAFDGRVCAGRSARRGSGAVYTLPCPDADPQSGCREPNRHFAARAGDSLSALSGTIDPAGNSTSAAGANETIACRNRTLPRRRSPRSAVSIRWPTSAAFFTATRA